MCVLSSKRKYKCRNRLGGMGIPVFPEIVNIEFQNSSLLTKEHVSLIARQERTYGNQKETVNNIKMKIKRDRQEYNQQKLIDIKSRLTSQQCRLNDINTEQGASTWLSTLSIEEKGYMLNKQEFWDLVNIKYRLPLSRTSRTSICRNNFNIENARTCKKGGFITLRHKRLKNITVSLLKEVSRDVRTESTLQKLTGEQFEQRAENTSDEAS